MTTMTIQEMEARSKDLAVAIRKGADSYQAAKQENKPWEGEARNAYEAACKEYDDLKANLEEARNGEAIASRIHQIDEDEKRSIRHGKPKPGLDDFMPGQKRTYGDAGFDRDGAAVFAKQELAKRNAMRAWLIRDAAPHLINEEMRSDAHAIGMDLSSGQMQVRMSDDTQFARLQREARTVHSSMIADLRESRALSKVATPGAELVPQSWVNMIELAMIEYGPLLAYVTTLTTSDGLKINYPTGDDTGNEGVEVAENADIDALAQPDPTMSSITLDAFEYISRFIKVPFTLSRDSIVNIDMLIAALIGERMGRIFTRRATTGTGTGQMQGIVTASAAGRTTASATAITGDELIDLQHSVDQAYRANGVFMCNDAVLAAIRKLKDTTGQYLWQSNLRDGLPDTILGRPQISNAYMAATIATTNITVLYGDVSKYLFRRVGTGTLHRLNERFAERLQTGYLFHQSADGRLIRANATTANPVKRLTQA